MQKTGLVLQPLPYNDVPPPPPTPTNEALLGRVTHGDGEALWMLYQRHADLLRDVIARSITDEEEGDDILREVFEDLRDRAVHYTKDKGYALGWLITLARQRALDHARTQTRQLPVRQPAPLGKQARKSRRLLDFGAQSGLSEAAA
jgi:DNA-directed RNA polymerase specialized sigma24 family protein